MTQNSVELNFTVFLLWFLKFDRHESSKCSDFVCKAHYALTMPDTHGTMTGAIGWEFLYDSGYLSLKFTFGFSACILIILEKESMF